MKTAPTAKTNFLQKWIPNLSPAIARALAAKSTWAELADVADAARAEMGLPPVSGSMEI